MGTPMKPRDPDPPEAVEEAESTIHSYRVRLSAFWFGGMAASLVTATQWLGLYPAEILPWLIAPSAVAGSLLIHPLGRQVGRARRILRRWEEIRTDRVLQPPAREDPRVRAGRMLAGRIIEHPSATAETEDVVTRILAQLEAAVADMGVLEITRQAGEPSTPVVEVTTDLEVRIARLLSGLGELHRALVVRESSLVQAEINELRDLLNQVHAETEVELLLRGVPPPAQQPIGHLPERRKR
ncbi:MAG: hypothetical protein ACREL7_03615 [Longimicrobiales bacterium]